MLMPGRKYAADSKYRYGFNGKENDNDVKGEGNQQDYGMRIYDGRLGRFLSVDPLAPKYPFYSPYQFAGNMPIWATDIDGLEPNLTHSQTGIYGVGLFDPNELGKINKHSAVLKVGSKDKQFQIQWLLNNNGDVIGYLASRVVPEEEYKMVYGGTGQGLQPAFVIEANSFSEFGKNSNRLFDISRNAEYYDMMWGEIDRSPGKRLFDPRAWLLSEVGGAAGRFSAQLFRGVLSRLGTMTNAETRLWYNFQLSKINTKVAPTELNARMLTNERNSIKSTARALMKDRKAAEALDKSDPIRPFEYYRDKYKGQGYEGENLWKKIIESSQKPNAVINAQFGIK